MSRKRDLVWDNYYAPHLQGTQFRRDPSKDALGLYERMYMRVLTELAVNRFKWTGLPNSIDPRFLELSLFRNALCVFFWNRDFGKFMALRASGAQGPNYQDNPTAFNVTGNFQVNKTLKASDCVPIWANFLRIPDLDIVMIYAKRLAEMDRTIELNAKNFRRTKVVVADENERLSYENLLRQHEEGVPAIFVKQGLDMTNVNVFDLDPNPLSLVNLQISKSRMWNECMTLLGINNANQDKKERLVSDEVAANDEQVFATRAIALKSRQMACEQINAKYDYPDGTPLNVSVDFESSAEAVPSTPGEALASMASEGASDEA